MTVITDTVDNRPLKDVVSNIAHAGNVA